jgi:hypothetical protein
MVLSDSAGAPPRDFVKIVRHSKELDKTWQSNDVLR